MFYLSCYQLNLLVSQPSALLSAQALSAGTGFSLARIRWELGMDSSAPFLGGGVFPCDHSTVLKADQLYHLM